MAACPCHAHTDFSSGDGYTTCSEYVERLTDLEVPGGFVTDHGNVAGWDEFGSKMLAAGLKPGYGIEAYQAETSRLVRPEPKIVEELNAAGNRIKKKKRVNDAAHLILLAQNDEGLRNIRLLSDESNRTGFYYYPRVDWELLEKHSEGVICTSACMSGLVAKGLAPLWDDEAEGDVSYSALNKFLRIFGDRFYIEMHAYSDPKQHILNKALLEIATERGIPMVYAADSHYSCESDYLMHEILQCTKRKLGFREHKGKYASQHDVTKWHPQDLFMMSEADVRERLSYLPQSAVDEAIQTSEDILNSCTASLPKPELHLPVFIPKELPPSGVEAPNNKVYMLEWMEKGLIERYGSPLPEEVVNQAAYEAQTICEAWGEGKRGLEDYFLIDWDFMRRMKQLKIRTGPGRGSAAGSILAYALGITKVDPLKYGLYFERFWNAGRTEGLPDIDLDIQKSRRAEAKQYLADRYGALRVISIGNHMKYQPKSALDAAAVGLYGPGHAHYRDVEAMKAIIDKMFDAGAQPTWEDIWADEEAAAELQPWYDQYPEIFGIAEQLTGRMSTYGKHASAVVISDVDLPEHLPCRYVKGEDDEIELVTQIEMRGVEAAGFPKFDFLGLKNLDVVQEVCDQIGQPDLDLDEIDYDNLPEDFWHHLEIGRTLGLFQIEAGNAARRIAKQIKARSISDLGAIVALNRPGPLRGGVVDRFIARRNEEEPVEYPHEMLVDILEESYGDFLYQEQVIAYFRAIGYSLGEADYIRGILGKKKVDKMAEEHPRYMERASMFMPEHVAQNIWDGIVDFSKYSFNKAHAIAYGLILAQTMYCKWRWPAEFIVANIRILKRSASPKKMEKIGGFIQEARRLGIEIRLPDVNVSDVSISVKDGVIYWGLEDVKYGSAAAAQYLIDNRPHESVESLNEKLAAASKEYAKLKKAGEPVPPKSPKQTCGKRAIDSLTACGAFDAIGGRDGLDSDARAALELEFMGNAITDPDADLLESLEGLDDAPLFTDVEEAADTMVSVTGVVDTVTPTKVRKGQTAGQTMGHIWLRWRGDRMRVTAFPRVWEQYRFALHKKNVVKCEIDVNDRGAILKKVKLVG